jgi:hypothetical protein
MERRTFGRRINEWLHESPGRIFQEGKWKFWYPTLIGLTGLNAVMTAMIFGQDGAQKYIGSIVVLAGATLCWLALGLLHYSDSDDRLLAIGVAALDSVTLLFVALHFSFLLWVQGHLWTLRAAEAQYRQDLATYNAQWAPVKDSNERIAGAVERIAQIEKETERLRNDTAYWSRRNGIKTAPKSGLKFEAAVTSMEVPPPPKAPPEASAEFLSKWDWWIRVAGFGELALSIVTLIFVRTRTATTNARRAGEVFPDEIDADERQSLILSQKKERLSLSGPDRKAARKKLLEHLKVIAFNHPGRWFKADLVRGGVTIRLFKRDHGHEISIAETTQSDKLLAAVDRPDFPARLLAELLHQGFPLEGGDQ